MFFNTFTETTILTNMAALTELMRGKPEPEKHYTPDPTNHESTRQR